MTRSVRSSTSTTTPSATSVITGTAAEGQTLTADTTASADADGLGAFSYQWLRNGANITGATSTHLHPGRSRRRHQRISVTVSYTDGNGTRRALTSDTAGPVINVNDDPVGNVSHHRHRRRGSDTHRRHHGISRRRRPRHLQLPVAAQRRPTSPAPPARTYTPVDPTSHQRISRHRQLHRWPRHR